MKTFITLIIGSMLASTGFVIGCSETVSHTETDKPNMLDDGRTHKETTTVKNADGSYTTESSKTRTSN